MMLPCTCHMLTKQYVFLGGWSQDPAEDAASNLGEAFRSSSYIPRPSGAALLD